MTQQPYDSDPFAEQKSAPAVSFKDKPVGTKYVMRVRTLPELVQSRDFETGERATWPDGNPKMSVVTGVDIDGEELSLWAAKPSAMFAAIVDAQKQAGARLAVGGTLTVEYIGDKPNEKNPRLNPQKQYRAHYSAPDAFAAGGDSSTQQQGWQSPSEQPASSEPPF